LFRPGTVTVVGYVYDFGAGNFPVALGRRFRDVKMTRFCQYDEFVAGGHHWTEGKRLFPHHISCLEIEASQGTIFSGNAMDTIDVSIQDDTCMEMVAHVPILPDHRGLPAV
jgi:hypothetical protein